MDQIRNTPATAGPPALDDLLLRISMLERALEVSEQHSGQDRLTGLANRHSFDTQLARLESQARRKPTAIGVITLAVDGLKLVNDVNGHHAGDGLILIVAEVLHRFCRGEDLAARLGGDEFAVLVHADAYGLASAAIRLMEMLQHSGVSATVGWAPRTTDGGLIAALQVADIQTVSSKTSLTTDAAAATALLSARAAADAHIELARATGIVMMWRSSSAELAQDRLSSEASRLSLPVTAAAHLVVASAAGEKLPDAEATLATQLMSRLRRPEQRARTAPAEPDTTREWLARALALLGPDRMAGSGIKVEH